MKNNPTNRINQNNQSGRRGKDGSTGKTINPPDSSGAPQVKPEYETRIVGGEVVDCSGVYDGDDTIYNRCNHLQYCEEYICDHYFDCDCECIAVEGSYSPTHPSSTGIDCRDVCGGTSVIDDCSECNFQNYYNEDMDDCGVCFGSGIAGTLDINGEYNACDCDGNVIDCDGVCAGSNHNCAETVPFFYGMDIPGGNCVHDDPGNCPTHADVCSQEHVAGTWPQPWGSPGTAVAYIWLNACAENWSGQNKKDMCSVLQIYPDGRPNTGECYHIQCEDVFRVYNPLNNVTVGTRCGMAVEDIIEVPVIGIGGGAGIPMFDDMIDLVNNGLIGIELWRASDTRWYDIYPNIEYHADGIKHWPIWEFNGAFQNILGALAVPSDGGGPSASFPDEECLTEILYPYTPDQIEKLIQQRRAVRETMSTRSDRDILYVPVVFHNLHQGDEVTPLNSYCDYDGVDFEYTTDNDQTICKERIDRSLEVLNLDYAPANVQFELLEGYEQIQPANAAGVNCMCNSICSPSDASLGDCVEGEIIDGCCIDPTSITDIFDEYNISTGLNIYLSRELQNASVHGFASIGNNAIVMKHGFSPGEMDVNPHSAQSYTLQHEMGHFFSLMHTWGDWPSNTNAPPRGLVDGSDCGDTGDLICDTPPEPGFYADRHFEYDCIYIGYNGSYDPETSILKIGGYDNIGDWFDSWQYNYCELWGFSDYYGIDENCYEFTNYDQNGEFFGTRGIPADSDCWNEDQSEFATECHIDNYPNLIPSINAMRSNTCKFSSHPDSEFYDPNGIWFTPEQYNNIHYSAEHDYIFIQSYNGFDVYGCTDESACNFWELANVDDESCWRANPPCDCIAGQDAICDCDDVTGESQDPFPECGGPHGECADDEKRYGCRCVNSDGDVVIGCGCTCDEGGEHEIIVDSGDATGYTYGCFYDNHCDSSGLLGDLNEDGSVNVLDIVLLIDTILYGCDGGECSGGIDVNEYPQYAHMDLTGDGVINVLDIVMLIDIILADTRTTSSQRQQLQKQLRRLDGLGGRTTSAPRGRGGKLRPVPSGGRTKPNKLTKSKRDNLIDSILRNQK